MHTAYYIMISYVSTKQKINHKTQRSLGSLKRDSLIPPDICTSQAIGAKKHQTGMWITGQSLATHLSTKKIQDMDVSENKGVSPQIIHVNSGFPFLTIHFGVPLFLETPIWRKMCQNDVHPKLPFFQMGRV